MIPILALAPRGTSYCVFKGRTWSNYILGSLSVPDINYIEKSNHLAAKEVRWRVVVGRFILGFGSIEWFTFHMLSELPTERILESTISLRFAQRVDLVIQLLRGKDLEPELVDSAITLLEKARAFSKVRNLIAHNPLFLNLFDDSVGVDLQYQVSKFGEIEARLSIGDLERHCIDVEELNEQLCTIRQKIDNAISL